MDLNLDSLAAFSEFSKTMNFTRAAEQLHISQPALHVKIKKLSQQLGVPLYTKQGKQLTLTRFGQEVARFARETQTSVEAFVQGLTGDQLDESVTLAAGRGSYLYLLGEKISQFKRKTNAALRLIACESQKTIELVKTGEAQIGFTVLQSKPTGVQTKLVTEVPAMLVVPHSHRFAKLSSIGIKNLRDEELIVPSYGRPHRTMISKLLDMKNVPWTIAVEADGWELAIEFARLEMGVAIVNGCCQLPKSLCGIRIRDFPGTKYYLVTKRSVKLTPSQETLKNLITGK